MAAKNWTAAKPAKEKPFGKLVAAPAGQTGAVFGGTPSNSASLNSVSIAFVPVP